MRTFAYVLTFTTTQALAQTWVQLPDFPGAARDDAAAFAIGEQVFVGTGYIVGWVLANDWYMFDAGSWQWDTLDALPASPRQYCSTFVVDGIGYLFGGLDAGGALDELWAFDPIAGSWTQRASLPGDGRYACASFAIASLGYVCTGMLDGGSPTSETWSYDPATDQWAQLADLPGTARHRAAACAGGQWAHIMGGADAGSDGLVDVRSFDSATGLWSSLFAPLPQPRYAADAVMMQGGTIFLMGGAMDNTSFHSDGVLGSSSSLTWSTSTTFPPGTRRGGVLARTQGDPTTAYFGTGLDSTLTRHNDWWMATSGSGMNDAMKPDLYLFPSPGIDGFRVSRPMRAIEVRDVQGRLLHRAEGNGVQHVDAREWAAGVHIVRVTGTDGAIHVMRWVKE